MVSVNERGHLEYRATQLLRSKRKYAAAEPIRNTRDSAFDKVRHGTLARVSRA